MVVTSTNPYGHFNQHIWSLWPIHNIIFANHVVILTNSCGHFCEFIWSLWPTPYVHFGQPDGHYRIVILGMNAAIRAVARLGIYAGARVYAIYWVSHHRFTRYFEGNLTRKLFWNGSVFKSVVFRMGVVPKIFVAL